MKIEIYASVITKQYWWSNLYLGREYHNTAYVAYKWPDPGFYLRRVHFSQAAQLPSSPLPTQKSFTTKGEGGVASLSLLTQLPPLYQSQNLRWKTRENVNYSHHNIESVIVIEQVNISTALDWTVKTSHVSYTVHSDAAISTASVDMTTRFPDGGYGISLWACEFGELRARVPMRGRYAWHTSPHYAVTITCRNTQTTKPQVQGSVHKPLWSTIIELL